MATETELSRATYSWWSRWLAPLAMGLGLWALVAEQMLYGLPRTVHSAQLFGCRLPWHLSLFWNTPASAFFVVAGASALLGLYARGWKRLVLLVGAPLVLAIAIHFSLYETQSDMLWAIDKAWQQRVAAR